MLADLIQSLLVTVLVLGLPGYYWARLLFPHLDWVEQGAFTVALSMTLVPAVALLLAWGWGPGVSWSIAAASVALVTLVGAAVFARFGAAPVLALHPKLDFPTLGPLAPAPLIPAALLMIAVFLGILGHRSVALPITLLVLLSAAFFVVQQVRRTGEASSDEASDSPSADAAPDEETTGGKTNPRLRRMEEGVRLLASRRVALPLVFLLVLVRGYSGPVLHDWPYIRGVDQYVHAVMVNLVMTQGDAKSFSVYPPGFHVLTAVLSRLSGLEPFQLFRMWRPALLLMPTVACYVLAQRLLGDRYGLAAAIFAGLLLSSPARFLNDGTYVDLMTAEFLLPLAIAALILLLEAPSRRVAVLFALIGASVVVPHHCGLLLRITAHRCLLGLRALFAAARPTTRPVPRRVVGPPRRSLGRVRVGPLRSAEYCRQPARLFRRHADLDARNAGDWNATSARPAGNTQLSVYTAGPARAAWAAPASGPSPTHPGLIRARSAPAHRLVPRLFVRKPDLAERLSLAVHARPRHSTRRRRLWARGS
ncbi:MAG: hypothetical protein WKH64_10090 [Chloroflexia bacterium]